MRLTHLVAMTALVLPFGLRAQSTKQPAATQDLELNLEARDVVRGVPTTFHIILRNVGKQDIRLPEPSLGCPSAVDGSVLLVERYKPQIPGDAIGFGCTAGRPYTQDILRRAKSWVLLRPGGYLERVVSPGRMHYENHGAGNYDLSAEYTPPQLTLAERRALDDAAFVYPATKLVSRHVVLKKDR